jgi:predicted dehydrogenase
LKTICKEQEIALEIDAVRHNGGTESDRLELGIGKVYTDIAQINTIYDVIFITNPTEYHIDTLKKADPIGKNFFIEKPIASIAQLEKASDLRLRKDAVYYVACPLRYNAVIQYIKENVNPADVLSVRSISSSYLPEWRPGTDYRNTYSAHKELGGGVSIDLIHEWDYLTYLFGFPQTVSCKIGKKSDLEIDTDDYAIYIAEYEDKIAELHLDYFGRAAIRRIELITKEDTIIGDMIGQTVSYLKSGKRIQFNEERDDFQKRELQYFLQTTEQQKGEINEIPHALRVLKLTQGGI